MKTEFLIGTHTLAQYQEAYDLSLKRPHLSTEAHKPNDYYGHITHLKNYCQFEGEGYCTLEHGFGSPASLIWEVDLASPYSSHWVMSEQRVEKIKAKTNKWTLAVGPYVHYAPLLLNQEQIDNESKRLGRSLLVFPAHSTHHNKVLFDASLLFSKIQSLAQDYDSVRCCLYWADFDSEFAEMCQAQGWEIVTAGHIYDPGFLARLKTLMYLSSAIAYNTFGTHVAYAAMMNKPQVHLEMPWDIEIGQAGHIIHAQENYSNLILKGMSEFTDLHQCKLTPSGLRTPSVDLKRFCGLASLRSPSELKQLFELNRQIQQIAFSKKASFNPDQLQRLDFDDEHNFELYREEFFRQQLNREYFQKFAKALPIYMNKDLF